MNNYNINIIYNTILEISHIFRIQQYLRIFYINAAYTGIACYSEQDALKYFNLINKLIQ